jgi:hypothetical protein
VASGGERVGVDGVGLDGVGCGVRMGGWCRGRCYGKEWDGIRVDEVEVVF